MSDIDRIHETLKTDGKIDAKDAVVYAQHHMNVAQETMKQPPYCDENGMRLISEQRERIAELEGQLSAVRKYLIPMLSWGLDDHTTGHIKMMIHITERQP